MKSTSIFTTLALLATTSITTAQQTTTAVNPLVSLYSQASANLASYESSMSTTIPAYHTLLSQGAVQISSVTSALASNPSSAAIYSSYVSEFKSRLSDAGIILDPTTITGVGAVTTSTSVEVPNTSVGSVASSLSSRSSSLSSAVSSALHSASSHASSSAAEASSTSSAGAGSVRVGAAFGPIGAGVLWLATFLW